jgi:N-acetylmuramoyl-L-alanine amidase
MRVTFLQSTTSGKKKVRVDYVLYDVLRLSPFASSATVKVYDASLFLPVATANGGTQLTWDLNNPIYNSVTMDVPMDKGGTYTFLISATDSNAIRYQGHWNRAALQNSIRLRVRKVWIDAGHHRKKGGATCQNPNHASNYHKDYFDSRVKWEDVGCQNPNHASNYHKEEDVAYDLAEKIQSHMNVHPHVAKLSRTKDGGPIRYAERAREAKRWGAEYVIHVHLNSSSNRSARGTQVYYYQGYEPSQEFANAVAYELSSLVSLASVDVFDHTKGDRVVNEVRMGCRSYHGNLPQRVA